MNNHDKKFLAITVIIGISLIAFLFHFQINQEITIETVTQTASTYESISGFKINETNDQSFNGFLSAVYNWGIAIAIILAVLFIAFGAIQYMSTDAISGKTEGREKIKNALLGLLLVLMSWLILYTINPDLLSGNFITDREQEILNETEKTNKTQEKNKINISDEELNKIIKEELNKKLIKTNDNFRSEMNNETLDSLGVLKKEIPGTIKLSGNQTDRFSIDLASNQTDTSSIMILMDKYKINDLKIETRETGDVIATQTIKIQSNDGKEYTYETQRITRESEDLDDIIFKLIESN